MKRLLVFLLFCTPASAQVATPQNSPAQINNVITVLQSQRNQMADFHAQCEVARLDQNKQIEDLKRENARLQDEIKQMEPRR